MGSDPRSRQRKAPDPRRREIGLERRERTRQKLLAAAARVVAELGESKATIDDFIQAAGVARGTFYNYYSTRDQLLDDLWKQLGRDPFRDIHHASQEVADPAERLAAEARMVLTRAAADHAWGWLVFALSADADSVNDDLLAYPRPDLETGRRIGRFQFDDLASATDLVVGTVRAALHAVLSESRSSNHSQTICILILKALGITDAEARSIAARPLPRAVAQKLSSPS